MIIVTTVCVVLIIIAVAVAIGIPLCVALGKCATPSTFLITDNEILT
jgi:hypothetical protein